MKASRKVNIALAVMSSCVTVGIFGAVTGTLAWYVNSTRVTVSFTGTSVRSSLHLQIGIIDNGNIFSDDDLLNYNLVREYQDSHGADLCDGNSIVWNRSSSLPSDAINHYLAGTHTFATTELSPVSSKSRLKTVTSDISLYEAPKVGNLNPTGVAEKRGYIQIPFAFKVLSNEDVPLDNKEVWLSDALTESDATNVDHAIRIHVYNNHGKDEHDVIKHDSFIINPSSNNDGATTVAGMLHLDGNDPYDYDGDHELIYGEYGDVTPTFSIDSYEDDAGFDEDAIYDVNDTHDTSGRATTFTAKHNKECKSISNWDTFKAGFKYADYYGMNSVKPEIAASGDYTGGKPIAYTDSACKIGYSKLTIWLEGWDHAIIDSAIGHEFNLGLTFEVNKIGTNH